MPNANSEHTPARRVVNRSPKRKVGYINCRWFQDHSIEHESDQEKKFIQLALLCPQVISISSQPFKMTFEDGRTYTPDFLLKSEQGEGVVVEVKVNQKIKKYHDVFNKAADQLRTRNLEFFVISIDTFNQYDMVEFCGSVLRHAASEHDPETLRRVENFLEEEALSTDGTAISTILDRCNVPIVLVMYLLSRRRLLPADYESRLTTSALVRLPTLRNFSFSETVQSYFQVKPWTEKEPVLEPKVAGGMKTRATTKMGPILRMPKKQTQGTRPQNPLGAISGGLLSERFDAPSFLTAE